MAKYLLRVRDVTGVEIRMTRDCWRNHIVVRHPVGKALIYSYDKRRDVLYVSVGQSRDAISREVQPGIFVHLHPRTRQVVGYTLLDFQRRASRIGKKVKTPAFAIPVQASFRTPPTLPASHRDPLACPSSPHTMTCWRMPAEGFGRRAEGPRGVHR